MLLCGHVGIDLPAVELRALPNVGDDIDERRADYPVCQILFRAKLWPVLL
jgi:hypothetical protein